ncbi:hypothetical protein HUJ04_000312 [Dendroctonus ponderosae]|nr:hypothetical protein HUJ04_000312 [Dendroctonus ponderosae]
MTKTIPWENQRRKSVANLENPTELPDDAVNSKRLSLMEEAFLSNDGSCSESSHQSHRDSRFVYGRYRQPPTRILHPVPYRQPEEEGIYESADHERGSAGCQDTPDSERMFNGF